ncbi:helix-turn-helix domain-containing protein [Streptomyces sp. NPDC048717]|uniref:helix-turn-helix domain-containing protein n=1 Tax=Streptomyces sp. NPDC048717 TaxID=3154928 RepID=UPI00344805FC
MTSVTDAAGFPEGGNTAHRRGSRTVSLAGVPVTVVPYEAPSEPGLTTTRRLGHLLFVTTEAGPRCYTRGPRRFVRGIGQSEGFFAVAVMGVTGAVVRQGGRTTEVPAGAVSFWCTERPHVVDYPDGVDVRVCLIPRRALGVRDDQLERMTATTTDTGGPVGALIAQTLLTLVETAEDCRAFVAGRLARHFTDLVVTLVIERSAGDAPAAEDSRATRIREIHVYVDRHLRDPELGPHMIAAAHGISVRSLHKLFEGEGITVSRLIRRRRLQESAGDLTREDGGDHTISSVARRWGFTGTAHFSRLFRAAYGIPPSQWRDTRGGTAQSC